MEKVLGLAMTGGGARGAYQAGVLKRIGEIKRIQTDGNPFPIIGGASAGAINGSAVAAGAGEFGEATAVLAQLWATLRPSDVFRCDLMSQTRNSLIWIMDLSFGGVLGGGNARSLLDATPLRYFLAKHLNCDRIQDNIKRKYLYALAISATNYNSGKSYLFIQGAKGHPMWNRSRRVTLATKITIEHICASAAIPLVFQPVRLKTSHGHGVLRRWLFAPTAASQPAHPAGGGKDSRHRSSRREAGSIRKRVAIQKDPSLAQMMGVIFNVMFLDHLATDIEHLDRLNQLLVEGHISQLGVPGLQNGCGRSRRCWLRLRST